MTVLGDLSEHGKLEELEKSKDILDEELKDIPYFPVLGNHDSLGFPLGSLFYDIIFTDEFYKKQFEKLGLSNDHWNIQNSEFNNEGFILLIFLVS